MPLLSEQLLVITSTVEPVGAIKQNLERDSLLISPWTTAPAPGGPQDEARLHKSDAPGGQTPGGGGRSEKRQQRKGANRKRVQGRAGPSWADGGRNILKLGPLQSAPPLMLHTLLHTK